MQATSHPLLWKALKSAGTLGVALAQAELKRPALSFLWDHSVQSRVILPGAAMFEMAIAFGKVRCLSNDVPNIGDPSAMIQRKRRRAFLRGMSFCVSFLCLQVLFGIETVQNEVALASGAIPSALVLSSSVHPVALTRISLASGLTEVCDQSTDGEGSVTFSCRNLDD